MHQRLLPALLQYVFSFIKFGFIALILSWQYTKPQAGQGLRFRYFHDEKRRITPSFPSPLLMRRFFFYSLGTRLSASDRGMSTILLSEHRPSS